MKRWLALCAILVVLAAVPATGDPRPPRLVPEPVTGRVVRALQRFELRLRSAPRGNPFDPSEASVRARFLGPRGQVITVNGFWYQDFERSLVDQRESLRPKGSPEWRVRFTPDDVGTWSYTVTTIDKGLTRTSRESTFRALAPSRDNRGFVRVEGRRFADSSGQAYTPVGENEAYAGPQATYAFDTWMKRTADQGGSWARVWIGPFAPLVLEPATGCYDLRAAWRLDHVLETAERCGVRLALCADSYSSLRIRPGPALWSNHPYNRAHGGFLDRPAAFFTDARARRLFAARLRYISARYGCSPNVFSWELMNEADLTEDFDVAAVRGWVVAMASALRGADPYAHPITISFGEPEGVPEIDALPQVDYVQTHLYGAGDLASALTLLCEEKARRYERPNLVSETGPSVRRAVTDLDAAAIWIHDALWAPVFAGAAGSGMPWWWDSHVHALDRYGEMAPLARFVRGVPWLSQRWAPLHVVAIRYENAPREARRDLFIMPLRGGWQRAPYNRPVTVQVRPDGTVPSLELLSRILHGTNRPELHNPATFIVDAPAGPFDESHPPHDGSFVVHILEPPTAGSRLRIEVDGRVARETPFEADAPATPLALSVPLSTGRHVLSAQNVGSGAITVAAYELPGYRRTERPALRVGGLASTTHAVVRVENEEQMWLRPALGREIRPVAPSVVVLDGFLAGDYVVEEWNTATGTSIPYRQRCVDGHITLHVPQLARDLAWQIRPAP